jgi:hypothetical protein
MSMTGSSFDWYCATAVSTPITAYRKVWKTVLTTIDGTPTTTVEFDYDRTEYSTVLASATKIVQPVAVF